MATIKTISRKITSELNSMERILSGKLRDFYNRNIRSANTPVDIIRQEKGKEIENLIRDYVESSWLFAHAITEEQMKEPSEKIRITTTDVQGIESDTKKMVNQYWLTSQRLQLRETEFKITPKQEIEQLPEFDIPAAMIGISALLVYAAFNDSMQSKAQELAFQGMRLRFTTKRDGIVDPVLCAPLEGKIFDIGFVTDMPPLHRHCRCHLIPIFQ